MKACWKSHTLRLTPAFILSLLLGGRVVPESLNPNAIDEIKDFGEEDLRLLIEEGRRQLDNQTERFRHATDRAQNLLTVSLIALGFVAGVFARLGHVHGAQLIFAGVSWGLAVAVTLVGISAAAAVIVVGAEFDSVDATQLANSEPPLLRKVATEYSEAVILGETTVAARVTLFRSATRFVCWGAVLGALAFLLTS